MSEESYIFTSGICFSSDRSDTRKFRRLVCRDCSEPARRPVSGDWTDTRPRYGDGRSQVFSGFIRAQKLPSGYSENGVSPSCLRSFQKGHKEKQIQLRSSAAGGLRPDAASVSLTQHSIFPLVTFLRPGKIAPKLLLQVSNISPQLIIHLFPLNIISESTDHNTVFTGKFV